MTEYQVNIAWGAYLGILGIVCWIYFIMYNWLWLGLVNATTIGWVVGMAMLFVIFLFLSFFVIIILCVVIAASLDESR